MLTDSLLAQAGALLNRGIDRESEARTLCAALAGRSLIVRVTGLPAGDLPIRFLATGTEVELSTVRPDDSVATDETASATADATITGSPIELNRLMFIDNQAPVREGRVSLEGDTDIAERFRELLLLARPDWEAQLSAWFGEAATFRIASLVLDVQDWMLDSAEEFTERTGEYLQDESQRVPPPDKAEAFYADVDELANDMERLEARILRLTEQQGKSN